jgi:predicted nucleic acid-binding protein
MPDNVFPDAIPEGAELELGRLAATHAALAADRREWRADVLLSACVEILTRHDLSTPLLLEAIHRMWHTSAVTEPELLAALERGQLGSLVVTVNDLSDKTRWQATAGAKEECTRDREWAQLVLKRFEETTEERLKDIMPEADAKTAKRFAYNLLRALAEAAQSTYVVTLTTVESLRPFLFDIQRVRPFARGCYKQEQLQDALVELAMAAIDPADDFGIEVVHLLVVGNLLQGLLAKRDLPAHIRLETTRILLDTSVLVDFIREGSAAQHLLENLVALSNRLGANVVVANHTLEEWRRVWEGADQEGPQHLDGVSVQKNMEQLLKHPFIAEFLHEKASNSSLSWIEFRSEREDIRPKLLRLGVQILSANNLGDEDRQVVTRMTTLMHQYSADESVPGHRSRFGAEADAESCAMVVRWRRENPSLPSCAYFIAIDYLTGRTYRELYPSDPVPLTINPSAWVTYAAALTTDDDAERVRIAEMVSNTIVRESFLGMATAYTLEEAMQLSALLSEDNVLSIEDVRTAVQLDLLGLLEETQDDATIEKRVVQASAVVLRRRSARRDVRAKRALVRADAHEESLVVEGTRRLEARDREIKELKASRDESVKTTRRLKRVLEVFLLTVALGSTMAAFVLEHWLRGVGEVVATLLGGLFALESVRFCADLEVHWWEPWIAAGVAAVWVLIAAAIGVIHL